MKNDIKNYIDKIFTDAPDCERTSQLKEEMRADVCDRYDDLVASGKSPAAAYNISIAGIGDVSELIESIKAEDSGCERERDREPVYRLSDEEQAAVEKYKKRSAVVVAIAVAMYIVCWIPLVVMGVISEEMGANQDVWGLIGLVVMMVIIAAATCMLILIPTMKPACLKNKSAELSDDDENDEDDDDDDGNENNCDSGKRKKVKRRKNPLLNAILSALWTFTVVCYLYIGFEHGLWHPGWVIFIIVGAVENIIEAIFDAKGKKYIIDEN